MEKNIRDFLIKLKRIPDFNKVKFIYLYGSQASGKASPMSDYDFAIYYEGDKKERFKFLLKASFDKNFDVKIFQDLPLYIRKDVLKGKVIYIKKGEDTFLYDYAYEVIKEFDMFKKYYYDYINRRGRVHDKKN